MSGDWSIGSPCFIKFGVSAQGRGNELDFRLRSKKNQDIPGANRRLFILREKYRSAQDPDDSRHWRQV